MAMSRAAGNAGLLWIAMGCVFLCLLLWAMATVYAGPDWSWIAVNMTEFLIVLVLMGSAVFILFRYLSRR